MSIDPKKTSRKASYFILVCFLCLSFAQSSLAEEVTNCQTFKKDNHGVEDKLKCDTCKEGFVATDSGSVCSSCPKDCLTCDANLVCQKCKADRYIFNGGCTTCQVENCSTCKLHNSCDTCSAGYEKKMSDQLVYTCVHTVHEIPALAWWIFSIFVILGAITVVLCVLFLNKNFDPRYHPTEDEILTREKELALLEAIRRASFGGNQNQSPEDYELVQVPLETNPNPQSPPQNQQQIPRVQQYQAPLQQSNSSGRLQQLQQPSYNSGALQQPSYVSNQSQPQSFPLQAGNGYSQAPDYTNYQGSLFQPSQHSQPQNNWI